MTLLQSFESSIKGQLIQIGDTDLLIELDEKAPKTLPTFLISDKKTLVDGQNKYIILTLDHVGSDLEYILVGNIFGEMLDAELYSRPEFFTPNRRDVLFAGDNGWLFDFDAYPQEIYNGEITFVRKVGAEVFGDTAVIKWSTEEKIVGYLLLLIEVGIHNEKGGWVEFYEGRQLNDSDLTF